MIVLPNPFMNSAATSFPAAVESAVASNLPPAVGAAAGTIEELMCVEPSLIRVLDAGRSGRTDCSPIDSIGRNPEDGAVKAWSPGPRAVTGDNSVGEVMLPAEAAAIIDPVTVVAAVPIWVIGHNPITQAVEIRPISDGKDVPARMQVSNDRGLARDDERSGDTMRESRPAHPATAPSDSIDCIGEIFHHARKLIAEDNRRAEDFVDWPALETALEEPLPLFIRDGEHLKRRAA